MKKNEAQNRRDFLKKVGLIGTMPLISSPVFSSSGNIKSGLTEKEVKFKIGVASWGLRKLSFDEVIKARICSWNIYHLRACICPSIFRQKKSENA